MRLISCESALFRIRNQASLNQVNIPCNLLLHFELISGDFVVSEHANEQVERIEVLLAFQTVLAALRSFFELVVQAIRFKDVRVVIVLCAHEKDSDVGLAHFCRFNALVFMVQLAIPA